MNLSAAEISRINGLLDIFSINFEFPAKFFILIADKK
jgi:hypothetical protein